MKCVVLLLAVIISRIYCYKMYNDIEGGLYVCSQPMEHGLCLAAMPRYAFLPALNACVRFTYGGCGGNRNNFRTLMECETKCPPEEFDYDLDDTIVY